MTKAQVGGAMKLSGGTSIPQVGLGVWKIPPGDATRNAVSAALASGYRHIDTAAAYGNEADVGAAIRDSGIPRDEIFVTTKLWNADQGYEPALRAFDASAKRLGLDYVDLYLVHWPVPGKRLDSWRALEQIAKDGRTRAIGVSNFLTDHLQELLKVAELPPAVNQIELHPFLQRRDTVAFCHSHNILIEAYSPLTHAIRLTDPAIISIAQDVRRTPAQVLLRWSLQQGNVVLPKSTNPKRIAENIALFDFKLEDDQVAKLTALDEAFATCWDPADVE
ncbi:MAG: aldo/keto reductase [Deltaproteobacteria bacterium]|nr:aldo/keto reductase [Deltaproteobacteria bacterium]